MTTTLAPSAAFPHQGPCRLPDGSVLWRLWAPRAARVQLVIDSAGGRRRTPMQPAGDGWFTLQLDRLPDGTRYAYELPGGALRPDPASRWQPDDVHGFSALFTRGAFRWTDADWAGLDPRELVIYELHVGTFTPEGTFEAAIPRLPELAELGVTAIELLPVAQFPGTRNWGYDGVCLYATQNSYGGPRGLQRFVDAAHRQGLGVLLDVVYNHLGPEGNYLAEFAPYFSTRNHTPWGPAFNLDDAGCEPVRRYVLDNAVQWVRDFHIDGLRLDAVQNIQDSGVRHLVAELQSEVRATAAALGRSSIVIGETNQNDPRQVDPQLQGGWGLDGVWADDFHHALHTLLTGERDGWYLDYGRPEQLAQAFNEVFVYGDAESAYRGRRHGGRAGTRSREQFIVCIQNHDQVGNRAAGERYAALLSPAAVRLAAGLLLISPCAPLLFMGEEYGETRPFPFFCSFHDERLNAGVRRGRREEFLHLKFHWSDAALDPPDPATFAAAILSWSWPPGSPQAGVRAMYRELLAARRTCSSLRAGSPTRAWLPPEGEGRVLMVERGGPAGLLASANLSAQPVALPAGLPGERPLRFSSAAARFGGPDPACDAPLSAHELRLWGGDSWPEFA